MVAGIHTLLFCVFGVSTAISLPESRTSIEVRRSKERRIERVVGEDLVSNHELQNFTCCAKSMAFTSPSIPCRQDSRSRPLHLYMVDGSERRHLGPTLQELRSLNSVIQNEKPPVRSPAHFLTSLGDGTWKNSADKRGKHLGPTFEEILQMKQESKNTMSRSCRSVLNESLVENGKGPTQVRSLSFVNLSPPEMRFPGTDPGVI
jgi:hypothetical protein